MTATKEHKLSILEQYKSSLPKVKLIGFVVTDGIFYKEQRLYKSSEKGIYYLCEFESEIDNLNTKNLIGKECYLIEIKDYILKKLLGSERAKRILREGWIL